MAEGQLFEDEEFPAEWISISFSSLSSCVFEGIVWKRPKDITTTPHLFVDGTSRRDVKQGILG